MTQRIIFDIEFVKQGFHPFKQGVALEFPDDALTRPVPKNALCMAMLEAQHPEIIAAIPIHHTWHSFEWLCGLNFIVRGRLEHFKCELDEEAKPHLKGVIQ
jgi:hypothetical protein